MTEEKQDQPSARETWQELGQQFRLLGDNLAAALKATWESEETRRHLAEMQAGLEAMTDELNQTTKKMGDSEEVQRIKVEMERAAQSAKASGKQTMTEIRPHLLATFRQIRGELDRLISRMEQEEAASETSSNETES